MKTLLVSIAVLVVAHLKTYQAASLTDERMAVCLDVIDAKLEHVKVPKELIKFTRDLLSLNPNLKNPSLNSMFEDKSVNLDLLGSGKVTKAHLDSLLNICDEYADDFVPILNETDCGEELLERLDSISSSGHAKLDELLGYAKLCSKVLN